LTFDPEEETMSSNVVVVHKNRTNTISVSMGMDVSADEITSQIRSAPDTKSQLIAEWEVSYLTDGTDGEVILTLDDASTAQIEADRGYMDLKRVVNNEPVPVFDRPLEVEFRGTVTA
jgi:hypothetical protein